MANDLPFHRVYIAHAPGVVASNEWIGIACQMRACLELRAHFGWVPDGDKKDGVSGTDNDDDGGVPPCPVYVAPSLEQLPMAVKKAEDKVVVGCKEGVFFSGCGQERFEAPSRAEFNAAMKTVMELAMSGPAKTFCHNRLHILEVRFNLHQLLNHDQEQMAQKAVPHRDFYNVRKIDNHVHASAMMTQKHLLRFIKHKLKQGSGEHLIVRDGQPLTLAQVFESLSLSAYDLSIDTLDMHADKTFHRFDRFNQKYCPMGESRLREIFLKYDNYTKGKFLAEITQQVLTDLEANKYQFAEYRLSIYGAKESEWATLSAWVVDNALFSPNVRWMIQVPRLYSVYRAAGRVASFGEMLHNIFAPLFAVTTDPSVDPKLAVFLRGCVGFDMVDDESLRERPMRNSLPTPDQWTNEYDPPYALFAYYLYANIVALNKLRAFMGLNTFAFRPHSGEAGDVEHLAASFLLARSINHGIMLKHNPALQYLFYLAQIGISMSPLSNNLLFLAYDKSPFPKFFKRGLNVTLSTDDPLMIHVTREPLVEEYATAAQVWKLSAVDTSEIARNSVLQSGFERPFKEHFVGKHYRRRDGGGSDIRQTNVPGMRLQFRAELLREELAMLSQHSGMLLDESLVDRII